MSRYLHRFLSTTALCILMVICTSLSVFTVPAIAAPVDRAYPVNTAEKAFAAEGQEPAASLTNPENSTLHYSFSAKEVTPFTVLTLGREQKLGTGMIGFWPYRGTTVGAHRCYIAKEDVDAIYESVGSRGMAFHFDTETDVTSAPSIIVKEKRTTGNDAWYTISGMRLQNKPTQPGLYINNLYGLFGIYEIPAFIGIPLTIFTIVFIVNAINLIDGIDGLAGCISVLALGGFMTYFIHYDVFRNTYTILAAGMIGALIAFLYFNLFGSPEKNTKIFMGDSGSLSLGYTLGFLAIKSTMDVEYIWPYRPEAILVPMTLLFVPSADVVRVTFFRLYHKRPLFDADKNHIHHKLMRTGLSQHQTLVFILAYITVICLFNATLYPTISLTTILFADITIYIVFNIGINFLIKRKS